MWNDELFAVLIRLEPALAPESFAPSVFTDRSPRRERLERHLDARHGKRFIFSSARSRTRLRTERRSICKHSPEPRLDARRRLAPRSVRDPRADRSGWDGEARAGTRTSRSAGSALGRAQEAQVSTRPRRPSLQAYPDQEPADGAPGTEGVPTSRTPAPGTRPASPLRCSPGGTRSAVNAS
jgi:hypothetical protein